MPTPSFSKDITSLFNNSELTDDLKYDVACRMVCETLNLITVSMLMYDAKTDKLTCEGKYLAPKSRSNYSDNNDIRRSEIIDNISVFEFFDANIDEFKHLTHEGFGTSIVNGETNKHFKISPEVFGSLKMKWTYMGYKEAYYDYKKALHNEFHEIGSSSISGLYFSKLLRSGKKLSSEIEMLPMTDGPQNGRLYFDSWEEINLTLSKENLYYIGLPIFANERYTGILRLTVYSNATSSIENIFGNSPQKKDSQIERLNNFAQLISLHLKTNYYLQGYRTLGNLKIMGLDFSGGPSKDFDELCNTLTNVIKCNGCILRLAIHTNELKNPPIKGVSDGLIKYKNYVYNNTASPFSEDLAQILKKKNSREREIKAVNFAVLEENNNSTFETFEYYYEQNLLRYEKNSGRLLRDFNDDYVKDLQAFQMNEVVVIRLENNESGFLILTNTKNRKFTSSDIEMILLASKRIGLEIKHQQDTRRINEQNKIISQDQNAKLIVHQIGAPVRALSGHAQNLHDKIFKEHEVPKKIEQLNKMSYALLRQLNSIQKYLDWEVQPVTPKKDSSTYSLEKYMRSRAIQFEGLTVNRENRKLRVWTIIENQPDFYDSCVIERGMLDEVINCLLDNSIKYSFSTIDMLANRIPFVIDDPMSPGHIHIILNSTQENLIITVENYGCQIDNSEYEKIFERGLRGKFGIKKSPIGSGIGLYLVKRVVTAYGGTVEVDHNNNTHLTRFKITLKHEF
jgi:signal transduction histidine kinase